MTRVLGVDLGSRRIGLAISDPTGTIASPLGVIERGATPAADYREIVARAREAGAERIVVGLPLSLSGREGPAARAARAEVAELSAEAGEKLPVEVHDERLTTVTAERALAATRRSRRGRRESIDAAAAAVILQSWLEAQR